MSALGQGTAGWELGGAIARCDANPHPAPLLLGRRAGKPPRRRITEPTSRRARKPQENESALSALPPRATPDALRECGVPIPPCSAFRLLSSPSMRATHAQAAPGVHVVGHPAPNPRPKASRGLETSVSGVSRVARSETAPSSIRHATSWFEEFCSHFGHFGQPFPTSQGGPPGRKCHLGSCLNQQDEATRGGFGFRSATVLR